MAETDFTYGPGRPEKPENYTHNRAEDYISGHAHKMIHDLTKVARLYSGNEIKVYRPSGADRCPECTDGITGSIVLSNCANCNGTGKINGFSLLYAGWSFIDVIPTYNLSTELGNADSPGGSKTPIVLIGSPILTDKDIIATKKTKDIYKIVNVGPQIVALQGIVVTQLAQCNLISPGSPEYKIIDW